MRPPSVVWAGGRTVCRILGVCGLLFAPKPELDADTLAVGPSYPAPHVLLTVETPDAIWVHCSVPKSGSASMGRLVRDKAIVRMGDTESSKNVSRCAPAAPSAECPCTWVSCPGKQLLGKELLRTTLVRNPYARFLSAYTEKFERHKGALRRWAREIPAGQPIRLDPLTLQHTKVRDGVMALVSSGVRANELLPTLLELSPVAVAEAMVWALRRAPQHARTMDRHVRPFVFECHLDQLVPDYVGRLERMADLARMLSLRGVLALNGTSAAVFARKYHRNRSRGVPGEALPPAHVCEEYPAGLRALVDELYAVDFAYISRWGLYTEDELWPCARRA